MNMNDVMSQFGIAIPEHDPRTPSKELLEILPVTQKELFEEPSYKRDEEFPSILMMAETQVGNWAKTPGLYETENVQAEDKIAYLHFFYGSFDCFVLEKEAGGDTMFCLINLQETELGYQSLQELTQTRGIELDFYWKPMKLSKVCEKYGFEM